MSVEATLKHLFPCKARPGDGHEESDSNFMRLIHLRSEDNAKLVDWIKRKKDKYTSGDMQKRW